MITFVDKIRRLREALVDADIAHGFGGAIALAYYVLEPRNTDDIDINICLPVSDAARVLSALPDGVEHDRGDIAAIVRDGQVRLRWNPDRVPIDLFFPQHPFHDEVARDITDMPFGDEMIPVISATHLTVFKTLFNRSKDWPDIEAMLAARAVDTEWAVGWVAELLGADSDQYGRLVELVARDDSKTPAPPGADMLAPLVDWAALRRARPESSSCAAWMPRAQRHCSRKSGHTGSHR